MTESRKPPVLHGKKKGGAIFPRVDLEQAVKYATKLVSKTHTGPQSSATLFAGVFGAKGSRGAVRSSALKQYGLMEGSEKEGFKATPLAIAVSTSAPEARQALLREACLKPKVFSALFATYHGDEISIAKLRQHAVGERIHPDELQNCADNFVSSIVYAGLGRRTGDQIRLISSIDARGTGEKPTVAGDVADRDESEINTTEGLNDVDSAELTNADETSHEMRGVDESLASRKSRSMDDGVASARAVIHVNVTIDSSLDTEKLEKQLALLRRFGAL